MKIRNEKNTVIDSLYNIKKRLSSVIILTNQIINSLNIFTLPESYYEELLRKMAKDNLDSVFLLPFQKILFNELSQEISAYLPLNDYVIRGFLMRGIKNWQQKHNQPVMALVKLDPNANLKAMAEILTFSINNMGRALFIPNKDSKVKILRDIFVKILDYYEEVSSIQSLEEYPKPDDLSIHNTEFT